MPVPDSEPAATSGPGPDGSGFTRPLGGPRAKAVDPGAAGRSRAAGRAVRRPPKISLVLSDRAGFRVKRKAETPQAYSEPRTAGPAGASNGALAVKTVALDRLFASGLRPRIPHDRRALQTLAAALMRSGWRHPILVRPHPLIARAYEVVVGDLLYQAARLAGLEQVTVVVYRLSDRRALECVLLEDLQRSDLAPLEVALGCGELIRTFNYGLAELAKRLGKSERQVARSLLLLDGSLSSRAASEAPAPKRELAELERRLSAALGLEVAVRTDGETGADSAGGIEISFATIEQFEWIVRRLLALGGQTKPAPTHPGLAA